MQTARSIAGILLILALTTLILVLVILGVDQVLDASNVNSEQCGMWYCNNPADVNRDGEVNVLDVQAVVNVYLNDNGDPFEVCSLVEQPTVTPTAVLCECDCITETPLVPTATPTHGTPPPTATRTPGPSPTPEPSSTPIPTSTHIPPEPTDKPKCNRGLGNNEEGCDPGNSGGNPGNAGEDNEPGGPPGQGNGNN